MSIPGCANLSLEFKVKEEAIHFLKGINGEVAVLVIAGKYRTGKSYLINLLIGQPDGFKVSDRAEGCT